MTGMTIGALAREAGVGVETVRFYHHRKLLPLPAPGGGAYRRYHPAHVSRIRFIKRAQELGFTLAEVEDLLKLNDGTGHKRARQLARVKLEEIERKLSDLRRMQRTLARLLEECERTGLAAPCPIIHLDLAQALPARSARQRTPPHRVPSGARTSARSTGRAIPREKGAGAHRRSRP